MVSEKLYRKHLKDSAFLRQFKEMKRLRWLNIVLAVCEYVSFAKSWREQGCTSQAETWQVKNIPIKDFSHYLKYDKSENYAKYHKILMNRF